MLIENIMTTYEADEKGCRDIIRKACITEGPSFMTKDTVGQWPIVICVQWG